MTPTQAALLTLALALGGVAVLVVLGRRVTAGDGFDVVVRCTAGHLFTTIWIPGGSVKAIRLGWVRLQYCPVGDHLAFVVPVPPERLTPQQRWFAAHHHDVRVP